VSSKVIVTTVFAQTVPSPASLQTEKPVSPAVDVHGMLTPDTSAPPHTPHALATLDVSQVEVFPSAEQTFVPAHPFDATHAVPRSDRAGQQTPHWLRPPTSQELPVSWSCAEQATAAKAVAARYANGNRLASFIGTFASGRTAAGYRR
jgi:hypothetical protein